MFSILLSNACHPDRRTKYSSTLRRVFYSGVAAECCPPPTNAHTGLDRLFLNGFDPLAGKRIALLTHTPAMDQLGRGILDVFDLEPAVKVKRIYSPEHGFRGQAEAGEKVGSENGPIPIISLYGKRRQPLPEELKDIDYLVVDLQDIGSRYYTYMATMKECMAACAGTGVPIFVLDRPNPVGGAVLEGPVAKVTGSSVCCAPIPVRHGMTLGELALYFRATTFSRAKLDVMISEVGNWPRDRYFSECSLPWTAPSPNMPTPMTALLYVGTCLFEGVHMNEGRGTDKPFHRFGAPWLDPEAVIGMIQPEDHPGCSLKPITYTPRSIPGKSTNPRHLDELCQGIEIEIHDMKAVRAFKMTTALLCAIHKRHPKELEFNNFFDTLAGGPWLREQIEAGRTAEEMDRQIQAELKTFEKKRVKRYPDSW